MTTLFEGYDTDKSEHSYEQTYLSLYDDSRKVRRFDVQAVLELGIFRGGSLRCWRDFFPNAQIVGFDIDPGTMVRGEERILTYTGNTRSTDDLQTVARLAENGWGGYDLIIDDASHRPIDQFHALSHLWGSLRAGGFYVIEDLAMDRNGADILTTCTLIVRGEANITLHLGDKQADDMLILEKKA